MIATGVVRHMDDLGRIVIPKEIRRKIGVSEGDAFEIYINEDRDGVVFKKYSVDLNADIQSLCIRLCDGVESYEVEQEIRRKCEELKKLVAG